MRFFRSHPILLSAGLVLALAVSTAPAMGQQPQWTAYSAKFVCGGYATPPPDVMPDGWYKTIVNIHNPHYLVEPTGLPVPVVFFKKVVLSVPQGGQPSPPSCKQLELLRADESLQMDCRAIKGLLPPPVPPGVEGFLVIEVPPQPTADDPTPPLDVVAVYASRPPAGTVTTMDVERVEPTVIIGTPAADPCPPD